MLRIQRRLDNKHDLFVDVAIRNGELEHIEQGIIKSTNNQPIALDTEPVILFRGRDRLAVAMLEFYRELCVKDGYTDFQLESMDDMIKRFREFAEQSNTMKQPGCTMGK